MIVNDGEEALKVFDTFKPQLILLDLMLPGIDGYQVCREIRAKSGTPIIMLSAKGEVFDKVLGLELGADDYIIKPFDSKELVARVKAVLRRYQPVKPAEPSAPAAKIVEYPGSGHQPDQLFRALSGQARGYAAQGAGASVFSGFLSQSGVYQRAASRPHLGLRVYRRHPYRGRPHQASPEKIGDHPSWSLTTVWGIGYKFDVKG